MHISVSVWTAYLSCIYARHDQASKRIPNMPKELELPGVEFATLADLQAPRFRDGDDNCDDEEEEEDSDEADEVDFCPRGITSRGMLLDLQDQVTQTAQQDKVKAGDEGPSESLEEEEDEVNDEEEEEEEDVHDTASRDTGEEHLTI